MNSQRLRSVSIPTLAACCGMTILLHALFFATDVVGAKSKPVVLKARSIVIEDSRGNARATFGLFEDGSVGLRLTDGDYVTRSTFTVSQRGSAGAVFIHKNARTGAALFVGDDGRVGLNLTDSDGKSQLPPLFDTKTIPAGPSAQPGDEESFLIQLLPQSLGAQGSSRRLEKKKSEDCRQSCVGLQDPALLKSCLTQCP